MAPPPDPVPAPDRGAPADDPLPAALRDAPPPRLPDVEPLPPVSVAERLARGLAGRDRVPLGDHASWDPGRRHADPLRILADQAVRRDPTLVPLRHGRMATSPFGFFRGAAGVMAADLSTTPTTGLRVQLCGDAHLVNFGIYDTRGRAHVFDLNDFDETLPGPWEWDVKRLAASVEVAGRSLELAAADRQRATTAAARGYRERIGELAEQGRLAVWHGRVSARELLDSVADGLSHKRAKRLRKDVRRGLTHNHLSAFSKLVVPGDRGPEFALDPPRVVPVEHLLDGSARERYVGVIRDFLAQYRDSLPDDRRHLLDEYRFTHMARKVVGVGSVGTRCWVVLLMGRDDRDPLVLQMKEAPPSVLEPYAGPGGTDHQGRRVVLGQRLLQASSDPLLGYYRLVALDGVERDFYVRQLWDGKASIEVDHLDADGLAHYSRACGRVLAHAHARSGPRISIAAYLDDHETFDTALAEFADAYADTNERDHATLVAAIADGRVPATAADGR